MSESYFEVEKCLTDSNGEGFEYRLAVDFEVDDKVPWLAVSIDLGRRWGDHVTGYFGGWSGGATKDTAVESTTEHANVAIKDMKIMREDLDRAIEAMGGVLNELESLAEEGNSEGR